VRDVHEQSRSSWLLFWRSSSFREELSDAYKEVRRLEVDADVSVLSAQNLRISQSTGNAAGISQMGPGHVERIQK
jgi:hypothetical protein